MLDIIIKLARNRKVAWKKHALKRLFERNISRSLVFEVLSNCEIIEQHELQRPLPSVLFIGFYNKEPLHVMLAIDEAEEMLWIITAYKPSPEEWFEDCKTRRQR